MLNAIKNLSFFYYLVIYSSMLRDKLLNKLKDKFMEILREFDPGSG